MKMQPKPLVDNPVATKFVNSMKTATFRRVHLGDPTKHSTVLNYVTAAHMAMEGGIKTVEALASDMTRSEPERHEAARKIADRTITSLQNARNGIRATAKGLDDAGSETVANMFALDPNRGSIETEVRQWIRERAKDADGIAAIRAEAKDSMEIAAILYESPRILLGIAEDVHLSLKVSLIEHHAPAAMQMFNESTELKKLAAKYDPIMQNVGTSFYNAATAALAKTRVEV